MDVPSTGIKIDCVMKKDQYVKILKQHLLLTSSGFEETDE